MPNKQKVNTGKKQAFPLHHLHVKIILLPTFPSRIQPPPQNKRPGSPYLKSSEEVLHKKKKKSEQKRKYNIGKAIYCVNTDILEKEFVAPGTEGLKSRR